MKQKVIQVIESAVKTLGLNIEVELTPAKGHGDFSTNIAMKLAAHLKDSPLNIAKKLVEYIKADFIKETKIEGPGFINIFLNENTISESINSIIKMNEEFGKGNETKFINVEFVSANPTGYLHIGHARGAVLGSVLVNVLRFSGNKVEAEYYINDAGNQINVLAESVKVRYLQELGIEASLPESSYGGEDIKNVAKWFVKKYGDSLKNEKSEKFKNESKKLLLEELKNDLGQYNVKFDLWSSEQKLYDDNKITEAIDKLNPHIYEKDGATWLDTTSQSDDKDRVLIKSDGSYTYLTPDIAYHNIKLSRGYDELINIWGADHIGYIKRMEAALGYLGLPKKKLDILTVQLVKLYKDGKELKMSKRMGTSYTIKELIEEVGVDAARWFMVDRSNNSEFVFNINIATSKTFDNPVFSVQYAHARANQLIEKSDVDPDPITFNKKEKELINQLNRFPHIIELISNNHKVHLLPQYLLEVVGMFNSWYSSTKMIGHKNEASMKALVMATKIVISNGLKLMGIGAPKKM